jgi:hypothetical protein
MWIKFWTRILETLGHSEPESTTPQNNKVGVVAQGGQVIIQNLNVTSPDSNQNNQVTKPDLTSLTN